MSTWRRQGVARKLNISKKRSKVPCALGSHYFSEFVVFVFRDGRAGGCHDVTRHTHLAPPILLSKVPCALEPSFFQSLLCCPETKLLVAVFLNTIQPQSSKRSSCEEIVHLCWILAENEGPLCSSMGWECKNGWSQTNTEGTSSIISKGCHWERPPKSHIKLTGRSCLKRQCTHMWFNNVELINHQWFSWALQIVCVLCIDKWILLLCKCWYYIMMASGLSLPLLPTFSCGRWVGDWSVWYPPICWLSAIEPRNRQYTFLDKKCTGLFGLSPVSRICLTANKENIE